jgi:hypothetical protein
MLHNFALVFALLAICASHCVHFVRFSFASLFRAVLRFLFRFSVI